MHRGKNKSEHDKTRELCQEIVDANFKLWNLTEILKLKKLSKRRHIVILKETFFIAKLSPEFIAKLFVNRIFSVGAFSYNFRNTVRTEASRSPWLGKMAALWWSILHSLFRVVPGKCLFRWDVVTLQTYRQNLQQTNCERKIKTWRKENYLIMLTHRSFFFRRRRFNASGANNREIRQCLSPISYAPSIRPTQVIFFIPSNHHQIAYTFLCRFQNNSCSSSPLNLRYLPAESISIRSC